MIDLPDCVTRGEIARLIPVTADSNKEQRAASILLAAFRGVHEFQKTMLNSLGIRVGKKAKVEAWTEVVFQSDPKVPKQERPDGLLVLDTGKKQWRALIEAKIGNAEVGEEQLKQYLQIAKENKLDAVITISNQFVALPTHHPIKLPKKYLKSVELYHWSWMYALTQATLLLEQEGVESEDQQFVLEEVQRYLSHDSSGVSNFDRMNAEWKDVVGHVKSGASLGKNSEDVINTVSCWHQEQRDLCLIMSRKLGQNVGLKLSRAHRTDPQARLKDDCETLVDEQVLRCVLDVPHAATDIEVVANLTKRTISCSMKLGAPKDKKRTSARVNWLTRQLTKAETDDMFVKAFRTGNAEETQAPLETLMNDANALDSDTTNVVPSKFEVFYMVDLAGRFAGNKVFIDELEAAVPRFYEQVGQRLRAWVAPPPKINRRDPVEVTEQEKGNEEMDEASG